MAEGTIPDLNCAGVACCQPKLSLPRVRLSLHGEAHGRRAWDSSQTLREGGPKGCGKFLKSHNSKG